MSLLLVVLNAIPQFQVGTQMVMEVAYRLLHFLIGTALSAMTATTVCNMLASMTCAMPALLVVFAPLDQHHAHLTGRHCVFHLDLRDGAPQSSCHGPSKDRDLPVARNLIVDDFGWWMPMERVYVTR
jgi:hypothetical protein